MEGIIAIAYILSWIGLYFVFRKYLPVSGKYKGLLAIILSGVCAGILILLLAVGFLYAIGLLG